MSAGAYHSLAAGEQGEGWAWGWNIYGQLGDGTTTDRPSPVKVAGMTRAAYLAAGALHSVALLSDGTVQGWGWNGVGAVGDGTTINRLTPVALTGLRGMVDVTAGSYHSLAVGDDGQVRAWGWNADGELGDGTTVDRRSPTLVPGVTKRQGGGGRRHPLDGRLAPRRHPFLARPGSLSDLQRARNASGRPVRPGIARRGTWSGR